MWRTSSTTTTMRTMPCSKSSLRTSLFLFCIAGFLFQTSSALQCECMNKILMLLRHDDFRVIFSPEYPGTYCGNLSCVWRVAGPQNSSKIQFFAGGIDLRPGKDFINFYESKHGMDLDSELVNPVFSCTGRGDCLYRGSGQFLTVQFKTAPGVPDQYGFQGTISLGDRKSKAWLSSIGNILLLVLVCVASVIALTVLAFVFVCKRVIQKDKCRLINQEEEETISTPLGPPSDADQKLLP